MKHWLPEWHPQWGVLLVWPHSDSDWQSLLPRAESCFAHIISAILDTEQVLLLCQNDQTEKRAKKLISMVNDNMHRLVTKIISTNDTWARDFGPLCIEVEKQPRMLDFQFNGWGKKFEHQRDNRVNSTLASFWSADTECIDLVLEGGSIDTDGQGNLLTTRQCLLNPNRNPELSQQDIETRLKAHLGIQDIWWLEHGHLEGDDTDAHIDTLARFCNSRTLAYMQCQDPHDTHYTPLRAMEQELFALASEHGLDLVPLPLPPEQLNTEGQRLPATYANFLIINDAVLVPVYDCVTDEAALSQLEDAFPERNIIPINCSALIEQHGSLHCVTMQLPLGVCAT